MARIENQTCDNCAAILFGMDRGARVTKNALEIKGQLKTQRVDPDTKWRQHEFISPRADADMAFCMPEGDELACLREFIEKTEHRKQLDREHDLREGARVEHIARLAHGYSIASGPAGTGHGGTGPAGANRATHYQQGA